MERGLSSIIIAKNTNINHSKIIRDIRNYIKNTCLDSDYFIENTYVDKKGETRPCYFCTLKGIKYIIDNKRKTSKMLPLINWYNNINDEFGEVVLRERFEDSFICKLKQSLEPLGYYLETQYRVLNYRLDGYIKELHLAIEYDEEHHRFTKKEDQIRQEKIKRKLGCEFVRCSYANSDAYNIGLVMNYILKAYKLSS